MLAEGLLFLSLLSSGFSSVCTLPGSELKALHLACTMTQGNSPEMTSQQHPERWAANPQCSAHHVRPRVITQMGEGSHADDRMMFTCAKWHRDAMEVLAAGMLACRERDRKKERK